MRIWIVGAHGMLGSSLQGYCQRHAIDCIATSHTEADITDRQMFLEIAKLFVPTHIVNCAAYTNVDLAESEPDKAFSVNADGAGNVAFASKEIGASLVHISTDYVFDGTKGAPYLETDPCAPISVYGRSKWEGEKQVLSILPSACVLRVSWLFGMGGKNFISSLLKWMKEKISFQVVADQTGRLTYCADVVEIIFSLLDASGIFHFANRGEVSRYEIATELLQEIKRQGMEAYCETIEAVTMDRFPLPAKRPLYSVLCTEKLSSYLGKQPRLWKEAVKEYLNNGKT